MEVLISLMRFRFENDDEWKSLLEDFFKHIRATPPQEKQSCRERISNFFGIQKFSKRFLSKVRKLYRIPPNFDGHLLGLFHLIFVRSKKGVVHDSQTRWYRRETSWKRYYRAKELKKVGILLKPSNTSLFTDVRFKSTLLAGEIYVPPLSIDDLFTKPLLLNLVVYEACLGSESPHLFTSYVCFMRSLIDSPDDVKKLRSQGILLTTIGSQDDHVAQLFKDMATNLVDNPDAFIWVKNAIKSHFSSTFWRLVFRYRGRVSAAVLKYSFLYGFVVSAIQAYVAATQQKPGFGNCSCTNATQLHH